MAHRPEQLLELARELASRTKDGTVMWEPTDQADRYVWATPRGSVIVSPEEPNGTSSFVFVVTDEAGNKIDEIRGSVMMTDRDVYETLASLVEAARASSGVVDRVVNSLLDDLRSS